MDHDLKTHDSFSLKAFHIEKLKQTMEASAPEWNYRLKHPRWKLPDGKLRNLSCRSENGNVLLLPWHTKAAEAGRRSVPAADAETKAEGEGVSVVSSYLPQCAGSGLPALFQVLFSYLTCFC